MHLKRAARVILIGAPGVGKGTQTERLLQRFPQLQSISTGDLLRSNVKRRTALGKSFSLHFIFLYPFGLGGTAADRNFESQASRPKRS